MMLTEYLELWKNTRNVGVMCLKCSSLTLLQSLIWVISKRVHLLIVNPLILFSTLYKVVYCMHCIHRH